MKNTLFCVIIDIDTTEIAKLECDCSIDQLRESVNGELEAVIKILSEQNDIWDDVLNGYRAAILFDGESMEIIRINSGMKTFFMDI